MLENFVVVPIFCCVWQCFASSSAKAFAWRVLLDRIPSKENLWRRQIIRSQNEVLCKFCNLVSESTSHLLFSCSLSMDVWLACYRWLGVQIVLLATSKEHFLQFSLGWSNNQRRGAHSIWLAVVWSLWMARNEVVFRNGVADISCIVDLVRWRSWHWIKSKFSEFAYSFFEWFSQPPVCL